MQHSLWSGVARRLISTSSDLFDSIEVERGRIGVGDPVQIVGLGPTRSTVVTSIESFHRTADEAVARDNAALLLPGVKRDEVVRGHVIAAPGSIDAFSRFEAQVYALRTEEGGRHRPFFRGTDRSSSSALPTSTAR